MRFERAHLLVVLVAAAAVAGCGKKIGDACETNVDCSPLGERFCDLSAPGISDKGGYCTIEGCDVRFDDSGNQKDSCPDEAVCIRFFSPIVTRPCDPPLASDPADVRVAKLTQCAPDERCLCDCSDPANPGVCLAVASSCPGGQTVAGPKVGHCAPETTERRWCMLRCTDDSDCRDGYECRAPGTFGAELVPGEPLVKNAAPKFCVQKR